MKVVAIALCILALVACANADCYDAVKNGDETSADCGGDTCWTRCSVGDACLVDSDCESQSCASGVCAVPDEARFLASHSGSGPSSAPTPADLSVGASAQASALVAFVVATVAARLM